MMKRKTFLGSIVAMVLGRFMPKGTPRPEPSVMSQWSLLAKRETTYVTVPYPSDGGFLVPAEFHRILLDDAGIGRPHP